MKTLHDIEFPESLHTAVRVMLHATVDELGAFAADVGSLEVAYVLDAATQYPLTWTADMSAAAELALAAY